jgi:acyl-CoA thioesterase
MSTNSEAVGQAMWEKDHASRLAGLSLIEVSDGRAVIEMLVKEKHVNGLGVCHGGYLFLLADSAMAFASNSRNEVAFAVAANIDFIKSARIGDKLRATADEAVSGKRTGISNVEVRTSEGILIAMFRGRTVKTGTPIL